jgi:hypothetical protein
MIRSTWRAAAAGVLCRDLVLLSLWVWALLGPEIAHAEALSLACKIDGTGQEYRVYIDTTAGKLLIGNFTYSLRFNDDAYVGTLLQKGKDCDFRLTFSINRRTAVYTNSTARFCDTGNYANRWEDAGSHSGTCEVVKDAPAQIF